MTLKSRVRSSMKDDMLEALLHVSINGPNVSECRDLIEQVTSEWLKQKPRRKLPKHTTGAARVEASIAVADVGTQVYQRIQKELTSCKH